MELNKKIIDIADNWFKYEPLLFNVFCSHKLEENINLPIMFRTGRGKIEYNPILVEKENIHDVSKQLVIEIYRILLKHPYQRIPLNPKKSALGISSDITIRDLNPFFIHLMAPQNFDLESGLCFEEYYKKIYDMCPDENQILMMNLSSPENRDDDLSAYTKAACCSELWQEDEIITEKINAQIEKAEKSQSWGSIRGKIKAEIIASKKIPMNYKNILTQFRTSIISSKRKLTRMKPNRRYGFYYMGSEYKPKTKLLVACDVSGSISNEDLKKFLSIINRFFNYGLEEITVLTFDVEIRSIDVIKKAQKNIFICGRGGTDFQPVINFYEKNSQFQGLIIFTDGFAALPEIHKNKPIMWILTSKREYEIANKWIKNTKGSKVTWIPKVK